MNETKDDGATPPGIAAAQATQLAALVSYGEGAVVSRTLAKGSAGTLTVFAFDRDQGLSEHSAPFDAWVQVLEGSALLTVGGEPIAANAGEIVLMPANVPHAVSADERFKMLLVMFKHQPATR